jgi:hypothetical protein
MGKGVQVPCDTSGQIQNQNAKIFKIATMARSLRKAPMRLENPETEPPPPAIRPPTAVI